MNRLGNGRGEQANSVEKERALFDLTRFRKDLKEQEMGEKFRLFECEIRGLIELTLLEGHAARIEFRRRYIPEATNSKFLVVEEGESQFFD
jgi:hypothetical protein